MNKNEGLIALLTIAAAFCAAGCVTGGEAADSAVQIIVTVPPSTPPGADLFIAGNFNNWAAADSQWRLSLREDGRYECFLPVAVAVKAEFKFTRGGWESVEKTERGAELKNRTLGRRLSVVELSVAAWRDDFEESAAPGTVSGTVVVRRDIGIPQLGREATVYVYLPPDYESSGRRYPVLYMHDGQNLFDNRTSNKAEWNVDEYMEASFADGRNTGIIVVGVACSATDRMNEYSPFRDLAFAPDPKGERYAEFLVTTLKSRIDAEYRTLPDRGHTMIGGSSMGSLISLYTALRYPRVYSGVLCFSSAFWIDSRAILSTIRDFPPAEPLVVYLDVGTREWKNPLLDGQMTSHTREVYAALREAGLAEASLRLVVEEGAFHDEYAWSRRFPAAFDWFYGQLTQ